MKKITITLLLLCSIGYAQTKTDSSKVDTIPKFSIEDINKAFLSNADKITFKDGQSFIKVINIIYPEMLKEYNSKTKK